MIEVVQKLFSLADILDGLVETAASPAFKGPIEKVREAAIGVAKAWSGGWLGYHSRVYYSNFQPAPAGADFRTEWGFDTDFVSNPTTGNWREYTFEDVRDHIFRLAGVRSLDKAERVAQEMTDKFEEAREELLSALTLALQSQQDEFTGRLKTQVEETKITSKFEFARAVQPRGQFMSRDMAALTKGIQIPPHLSLIAEICALQNVGECCDRLSKVARRAASHLDLRRKQETKTRKVGTNVFIGHGRSLIWKDLKDFVQDRIGLPWDEFNRVPVAGVTNITRLNEMLENAAIAFLVLTGEDEQSDAKMHPRLNVVHEAGLFQGRLGFTKAIVLLEEDCAEFSNINGLGQIRFPRGNISAVFEEIRRVLEREELIGP